MSAIEPHRFCLNRYNNVEQIFATSVKVEYTLKGNERGIP